jgi:hypothetical protein
VKPRAVRKRAKSRKTREWMSLLGGLFDAAVIMKLKLSIEVHAKALPLSSRMH